MSKVAILRHGEANYDVLKINNSKSYRGKNLHKFKEFSSEIKDLKESKITDLKNNIKTFIIDNKQKLVGRTIQTANILFSLIEKSWLDVSSVSLVENLQEVKNFSWNVLYWFVNWWDIELNWKKIYLDKNITNPKNLNITDYFFEWWYKNVDDKYLKEIWIWENISQIETYDDITSRSKRDLNRIFNAIDKNTFLFVVSHQAFTDWIYRKKDNYKTKWQQPWEILQLDKDEFCSILVD